MEELLAELSKQLGAYALSRWMKPTRKQISAAAYEGNVPLLEECASRGADFNEVEERGNPLLEDILFDLCVDEKPFRYDVARALLRLGADPNVLGCERGGPLVPAMLRMDTEMLRILLVAGADPNRVAGFLESETLYDWARSEYWYEMQDFGEADESTEEDRATEDAWLRYLDRMAIKHRRRRPDYLFLLREYGARSAWELSRAAGQAATDNSSEADT